MTPSDDLFQLIRSLSRSEKGYFRKFATRSSGGQRNDYLVLFDAIDRMESHDEEALRAAIASKGFAERLPAVKHYLYRSILKSLRAYHDESSVEWRLRAELASADILYRKGLHDQAWKAIARVKKLARRELKELPLLNAIHIERVLISNRGYHEDTAEMLSRSFDEERELLQDLLNISRIDSIGKRIIRQIMRRGGTRNEREREELDALFDHDFLDDERNATSPKARFLRHHVRSSHAFAVGNFEECYRETRRMVEILKEDPALWSGSPERFLNAVNNLIGICQFVGRFDEALAWLDELRRMPELSEQFALDKFTSVASMELTLLLKQGRFERALALVPEIDAGVARFGARLSRTFTYMFGYHLAWTYIGVGRYREALARLQPILNDGTASVRDDLVAFARILNLVIHFELGNRELLPYAVRASYRALYKRGRLNGVESLILRSLRAMSTADREEELRPIFTRMIRELEILAENPEERKAFQYFHFIPWLRCRLEGKLLVDMLRSAPEEARP